MKYIDRYITNCKPIIAAQIECADLIILSKVDCLQQAQLRKCCAAIKALNSSAVLEVCHLHIAPDFAW